MALSDRIKESPLAKRALQEVNDRAGQKTVTTDRLELLEASDRERRSLQREMDLLGWNVLDYISGQPQEVKAMERRKMAAKARLVWLEDPQAGAAIDLRNNFVFGRGVPRPKAVDKKVQEVIDAAWDDPDNQTILTSYEAQVALGTDMSLQSNVFVLFFDDGDDGKVKLGILDHDAVDNAVRDEDMRQRVLYYVARDRKQKWNYSTHQAELEPWEMQKDGNRKVLYYEHFANIKRKEDEGETWPEPPAKNRADGRVYHMATNRTSEQVFGTPSMRRVIRWMASYNYFMAARVDMAQAAAAFIMKRKIKGSPTKVAQMAAKAISRESELAGTVPGDYPGIDYAGQAPQIGPRSASILNENEAVSHENMSLNSNAGQAMQDAQMIRAQISAGTGWPQAYFGDASSSNLATSTSLELPILKSVEGTQELFEGLFRAFIDRVIERAVEKGTLPSELDEEERAALRKLKPENQVPGADPGTEVPAGQSDPTQDTALTAALVEYDGQHADEAATERDLSYEFSMPNPLKRAVNDLVGAVSNIARTFDPNNSNMELSRTLLAVVLGEGLEIQDPAAAVERIFPEGYVDPAIAAAQAAAAGPASAPAGPPPDGAPPDQGNFFGPEGQGNFTSDAPTDPANPYGAPGMSTNYKDKQGQVQEAEHIGRNLPQGVQLKLRGRVDELSQIWDEDVFAVTDEMLGANGNGHGT